MNETRLEKRAPKQTADQYQQLAKVRDWFKAAANKSLSWRNEAIEDYRFVAGKQWDEKDRLALLKQGRPAITINKIKPQLNLLSGYQRLNRYDIDFLPRTSDDQKLCDVRKGMTKYVMDETDYEYVESQVFLDAAICGVGWFEYTYQFDILSQDGEVKIKRVSPFSMYVDPEAREQDFSDAKFIIRARWVEKDELIQTYPEHAERIKAQAEIYDKDEQTQNHIGNEPMWYQKDLHKLRLCECWYKSRETALYYLLADGQLVPEKELSPEMMFQGLIVNEVKIPAVKVRVCAFFDEVILEDTESPYEHGEFPFVPLIVYHFGEGDTPAGVVRDLKDPQREVNKRRVQELHILNTASNSGWMAEQGSLTPEQRHNLRNNGAVPGVIIETAVGAIAQSKIMRLEPVNPPVALIQASQQAASDIPAISGINEALMGVDMPASTSGRAIELKQKSAITHIAMTFDNLRRTKKKGAYLLWGKRQRKGLIPQYYTDEKVYRIIGTNGQMQFIAVNQQQILNDPIRGTIKQTLNDLSAGEFDIVIADTSASATQRTAQFWSLVDAISKIGIPGDMVFDILIDLSDIPNRDEIKERWQQRQQQQQQQAQAQQQAQTQLAQMQLQEKALSRITYKDAIAPVKMLIDAKSGVYGDQSQIMEQAAMIMLEQFYAPYMQAAAESARQEGPQGQSQEQQLNAIMQVLGAQGQQTVQDNNPQPMTQSAMNSLMAGQTPAI